MGVKIKNARPMEAVKKGIGLSLERKNMKGGKRFLGNQEAQH